MRHPPPLRPLLLANLPHLLAALLPPAHPSHAARLLSLAGTPPQRAVPLPPIDAAPIAVGRAAHVGFPDGCAGHGVVVGLFLSDVVPSRVFADAAVLAGRVPGWVLGDCAAGTAGEQGGFLVERQGECGEFVEGGGQETVVAGDARGGCVGVCGGAHGYWGGV